MIYRDSAFNRLRNSIAKFIAPNQQINKFNEAFLVGHGGYTNYPADGQTYIEKGYNVNPLVYSIVNEMASKTSSVPFYIKDIEDNQANRKLNQLMYATKGNLSMNQYMKYMKLQYKAYSKEDRPFPLMQPNPNQTWTEFMALYKTFIRTTGNAFLYFLAPEEGLNAGTPKYVYLLPSHFMQIVIKPGSNYMEAENPVEGYMLTYGRNYIEFEAENVIHIKYSNPNYDENGEHLYGLSPLAAALRNIHSSNEGIDNSIRMMRNSGSFGLIHSKGQHTLTVDQATALKEKLVEMDSSDARLSRIAGVSAEIGFTRLNLTSNELKPFDYLNFDEKQIADCLNWEIIDGNRGDYGGTVKEIRKQRIIDNIKPDLQLLEDALNQYFLPRFKGYENSCIVFDVMELPEMQSDVAEITKHLNDQLDRGVINRDEYREMIGYLRLETEEMEAYTVNSDVLLLSEAIDNSFNINGTSTN